jgi:hypothetical protein
MHNIIPMSLAGLVSLGIILIGCFYVISPQRMVGSFGLNPPAPDADTRAWLRLKGIRDVATGLALLTLMLTTDSRAVGLILLAFSVIPFGDMSNILVSGGRKVTAFSVHGVTCAVMIFAGLLLIHAI